MAQQAKHGRGRAQLTPAVQRLEQEELKRLLVRLRELRAASGLTQQAFAERTGRDERTIRAIEGGHSSPTFKSLICCCVAYGIDLGELFARERAAPRRGRPR